MKRMLAVFAHPDDESCLAGGILARCVAEGFEVTLVCATRGEQAPPCCLPEPVSPAEMGRIRERELRCAARVLGIHRVWVLDLPDGGVRAQQARLEAIVVRLIRGLQPMLVLSFGPDGVTGHVDHIAVGEAVARAVEAAERPSDHPDLMESGLRPWRVPLYYQRVGSGSPPGRGPLWRVDISVFLWTKIRALYCHASQRCCWEPMLHMRDQAALRFETLQVVRGHWKRPPAEGIEAIPGGDGGIYER